MIPDVKFSFLSILLLISSPLFAKGDKRKSVDVSSPHKSIKVTFQVLQGIPYYSLHHNNNVILSNSRLGFVIKGEPALDQDFKIINTKHTSFDETWTQPWGEVKSIRNNYNGLVVTLEQQSSVQRTMEIEFRVYDDGIGFRYSFQDQPNLKDFVVIDELTEFSLTNDMDAWWIPAYGEEMDLEWLFKKNKVSELKEKMHTPLTLEGNGLYVSIHEAALVDYSAMTLFAESGTKLKCDLVPWSNGDRVQTSAPMHTPWRTIQVADKPGDLITSYLILNLNEPNKLGDVSWIKPGKYNGMWWGMHMKKYTWEQGSQHGATTANVKELIDFASEHKLAGVLVEGWNEGWEGDWSKDGNFNFTKPYSDYDIAELSRYAKEKNVGLIAHHETGGNVANYEAQLEDAFKFLQSYDIHMLKTGYVNKAMKEVHQSQFMVQHYQKVMETAARYHVMLDVHEPVKATGLRRTYPNMMTREGGRGMEYEAWSEGNPPSHTTILPFTRCLAGPMDFTPGIFDIQFQTDGDFRVHTTIAKQLALYVVIYSPFQMAADLPENYKGKPAFKFIEDVPVDWETTKVLDAHIGKFITTVRKDRNSGDWYLGSITNEDARTITIKLDFLSSGKKYIAEIYKDGKGADVNTNPLAIEIEAHEVTSSDVIRVNLATGGGAAIRFHEVQ